MKHYIRTWFAGASAVVAAGTMLAGTAPSAAASDIKLARSCLNSYECVISFTYSTFNDITIDVDANGGIEQPIAVSIDFTDNCHPTIYPSQPMQSIICSGMYKGSFTARVYGGTLHDYYSISPCAGPDS
jgi:hypothetical protein